MIEKAQEIGSILNTENGVENVIQIIEQKINE